MALKPQDVLVALKLAVLPPASSILQIQLAESLGLSPAEISNSRRRLAYAQLFVPGYRAAKRLGQLGTVRHAGLCEFAIHGVRYRFPARLGER
jgi:hypothetical protein